MYVKRRILLTQTGIAACQQNLSFFHTIRNIVKYPIIPNSCKCPPFIKFSRSNSVSHTASKGEKSL